MRSFKTAVCLSFVFQLAIFGACSKKSSGSPSPNSGGSESSTESPVDPFEGIDCDVMVEASQSAAEFMALMENGASSSSPFIMCINSGVTVNADDAAALEVGATNISFYGADSTSVLKHVYVSSSTTSNEMRFQNLTLVGGGSSPAIYVEGDVHVTLSDVTATATGETAALVTVGTLTIDDSSLSSTESTFAACAEARSNNSATLNMTDSTCSSAFAGISVKENSTVTVTDSTITSANTGLYVSTAFGTSNATFTGLTVNATVSGLGFNLTSGTTAVTLQSSNLSSSSEAVDVNLTAGTISLNLFSSTLTSKNHGFHALVSTGQFTTTLKSSTFKRAGGSGSKNGISYTVSGGTVTLNDTSTTPKNLFCTTSGSPFTSILSTSGTVGGTFSATNTQNGSNTNITACP